MTKQQGFTLVELMIAVAIIAIIASIAIPSYQDSIAKSRRADAQGALMAFSSAMERYYTENNTYLGAADAGADEGAPAGTVFPSQAPLDGTTKYYNLTISDAEAISYELSATPIAGGGMAGDVCGTFKITSAGVKSAAKTTCWK